MLTISLSMSVKQAKEMCVFAPGLANIEETTLPVGGINFHGSGCALFWMGRARTATVWGS